MRLSWRGSCNSGAGGAPRAAKILREAAPGLFVSASADVFPNMREFERWTTTAVNAFTQPMFDRYLERLETGLANQGFRGRLYIMSSSGGTLTADTARRYPVRALESGPAAGALMSAYHGRSLDLPNLLSFDMGGTTAKGAIVRGDTPIKRYSMEVARVHEFRQGSGLPIRQSEAAMRAKIRELGDGTHYNRMQVEGFDGPCDYVVRIDIKGDSVACDFTGTSGCVRAGVNVPFCYTNAMALHAIKSLLLPTIPNNAGSIAPISVFAPTGCILNAQPPFATGGRHAMGHFVTPLVYGALAQAAPDRVQAGSGMMNLVTFQGTRRDERPFSTIYFAAGGYGALRDLDGRCTLPHPSNMAVVPVEVWEALTHTTIESKKLVADSGGPGRWRGGLGQDVVLRNDTGHPVVTLGMGNRTMFPARGMFAGGDGALRVHAIDGKPVHAKGRNELAPGQRMRIVEAGGGGYGDPRERAPAAVDEDVAQGYVTADAARDIYGSR